MIIFHASEVAALLGRHRFKTKGEALVRVLSSIPAFRPAIESMKKETGVRTDKEIVRDVPIAVKQSLEKAVTNAVATTDQTAIQQSIEAFQKETTARLLSDALRGSTAVPEFAEAARRVEKGESTVEQEEQKMKASPVVKVITQEIQKQRGTRMEAAVEDKRAATTGKAITDRNTPVRYECPEYTIVGYIDGMEDNKIVETKNRKRFWPSVPEYDIIQLRCYMKMKGGVDGMLLEQFPSGQNRVTPVEWDEDEWSGIHQGLCWVATEVACMTPAQAASVVKDALLAR